MKSIVIIIFISTLAAIIISAESFVPTKKHTDIEKQEFKVKDMTSKKMTSFSKYSIEKIRSKLQSIKSEKDLKYNIEILSYPLFKIITTNDKVFSISSKEAHVVGNKILFIDSKLIQSNTRIAKKYKYIYYDKHDYTIRGEKTYLKL